MSAAIVRRSGPLTGVRVVELEGIGPAPYCGMLLADMGAEVIRILRPGQGDMAVNLPPESDPTVRGKRTLTLDLKQPQGAAALRALLARCDLLIEGHRPGVMERLGLGPEVCLADNPRLVYGRVTGWGQDGPLALRAGHDINYIALSGGLHAIGTEATPLPPLNLVGDFAGGALFLALGLVSALLHVRQGGPGQVVDAAMLDGTVSLLAQTYGLLAAGQWTEQRGSNVLDGAAPWYGAYATADGRHMAVGAVEDRFWAQLLHGLGLEADSLPAREDRVHWPALRAAIAGAMATRTQHEWEQVFAGTDACVSPVLTLSEAPSHAHLQARGTFVDAGRMLQPAPAPRFSATPGRANLETPFNAAVDDACLADWGLPADQAEGVLATAA